MKMEVPDRPPDSISVMHLDAPKLMHMGFWLAMGAMLSFALVYCAWRVLNEGARLMAGLPLS